MKTAIFKRALTVAFSEEIYSRIKEITDEQHISMGEWMRIAAEKELNNNDYNKYSDGGNKQ
jgi:hypothetical protein